MTDSVGKRDRARAGTPQGPLRVLVLNWLDRGNPQAGGAEIHFHETFGRLAGRGWDVTLVSSGFADAAPRTELDGIRVLRVGGRHTYPLHATRAARRLLSTRAYDVVVEDLNKVPLFAPVWAGVPVLLLVHHLFGRTVFEEARLPLALATFLLERPIPRLYRGVPVVAVSESTRTDLVHRGLDPRRIEVVPNGVAAEGFTPAPPGDRFPDPTALYLGRLKRYKRVDLVLRAVAKVREAGMPVRLLVAGKGDHRPALEDEARRLGLGSDGVSFLGFVSEEQKRELLARTWVHCLTSPKEGWGIANLEAAASGTPTVASDSPGLRDSVEHGVSGFLVRHGDVDALAARILELVRDGELRDRLGEGGRRMALRYSWEAAADQFERSLRRVVAGSRPSV